MYSSILCLNSKRVALPLTIVHRGVKHSFWMSNVIKNNFILPDSNVLVSHDTNVHPEQHKTHTHTHMFQTYGTAWWNEMLSEYDDTWQYFPLNIFFPSQTTLTHLDTGNCYPSRLTKVTSIFIFYTYGSPFIITSNVLFLHVYCRQSPG